MYLDIDSIRKEFRPFISEVECGHDFVTVWLRDAYVFADTSASISSWYLDDYENLLEMIGVINTCIADELIEIQHDVWIKGAHHHPDEIVNHNPANI